MVISVGDVRVMLEVARYEFVSFLYPVSYNHIQGRLYI